MLVSPHKTTQPGLGTGELLGVKDGALVGLALGATLGLLLGEVLGLVLGASLAHEAHKGPGGLAFQFGSVVVQQLLSRNI